MRWWASILFLMLVCGCSPTQRIAEDAQAIVERTSAVSSSVRAIAEEIEAGPVLRDRELAIAGELVSNADELDEVVEDAQSITNQIPKVEDKFVWADAIFNLGVVASIIALAVIVWKIGPILQLFGWFAPRNKKAVAKLAIEGRHTEAVAVMRADDPSLDRAFKKQKKERDT